MIKSLVLKDLTKPCATAIDTNWPTQGFPSVDEKFTPDALFPIH